MAEPESELSALDLTPLRARLKGRREHMGLSLEEVQELTGINSSTLSRIERNLIANPSWTDILKLAELYKLSPSYLAELSGMKLRKPASGTSTKAIPDLMDRLEERFEAAFGHDPALWEGLRSVIEQTAEKQLEAFIDNSYYIFGVELKGDKQDN